MKKIMLIAALLVVGFMNAQVIGADLVNFIVKTTAEMNAITVGQGLQEGSTCYNSTTKKIHYYDGSTWNEVGSGSGGGDLSQTDIDTFSELNTIVTDETLAKQSDIGVSIQAYNANTDIDSTDDVTTSGNQTIGGEKTFTTTIQAEAGVNLRETAGNYSGSLGFFNATNDLFNTSLTANFSALWMHDGYFNLYSDGTLTSNGKARIGFVNTDLRTYTLPDKSGTVALLDDITGGGTPDDDSVTPAKMADGDFGDFSVASNVATIDSGVITVSKMSNNTHGLFGWASNGSPVNYPIASAFESIFGGFANNDQAPLLTDRFPFREGSTPSNARTATFQQLSDLLGGSDDQTAAEVTYDNTTSGLAATNVKTAIDEVKAESIESDATGYGAGVTTIGNILAWDYDTNPNEPTPIGGDIILGTDVPNIKVTATATWDTNNGAISLSGWDGVDDRTIDEGTFTLSNAKPGYKFTVWINRASAPTLSGAGLTFNALPNTTAFAAATEMAIYFEVGLDGTTVDYYYYER